VSMVAGNMEGFSYLTNIVVAKREQEERNQNGMPREIDWLEVTSEPESENKSGRDEAVTNVSYMRWLGEFHREDHFL
jgi:hypothetical protein